MIESGAVATMSDKEHFYVTGISEKYEQLIGRYKLEIEGLGEKPDTFD